MRPHVDHKDRRVQVFAVLHRDHGSLGCIHAADAAAVLITAVAGIARPDALDERNALDIFIVAGTQHTAERGTRGAQQPFELRRGNHVGEPLVSVLAAAQRVEHLVSTGYDHAAYLDLTVADLVVEPNCVGLADLLADLAFAQPEIETIVPVDHGDVRDGLRVRHVDRLAHAQAPVELARYSRGAFLPAQPAPGASFQIDAAGSESDGCGELSGLSFQVDEVRQREDLDVVVLGHADKARAHRAHGAVIGGEGLVEHRHVAAKRAVGLQEINPVSRRPHVQGGLYSGDAPAEDQNRSDDVVLEGGFGRNHQ